MSGGIRTALLWAIAAVGIVNGLWMLLAPVSWYHDLPAAVPDFGPLNIHFVRDIGAAYLGAGIALALAAVKPAVRRFLVPPAAVFFVLHAAGHVADTAGGVVGAAHWLIDFPGVYLPALVLVAISVVEARQS